MYATTYNYNILFCLHIYILKLLTLSFFIYWNIGGCCYISLRLGSTVLTSE